MNFYYTLFQILKVSQHAKTLSEVANELYLSQPYVSKVIKKGEERYNVELIDRKSTPIQITDSGVIVLKYLRTMVSSEADLKNKLAKQKYHPITILLTNTYLEGMVLDLIAEYEEKFPELEIRLKTQAIASGFTTLGNADNDLLIGKRYVDQKIETLKIPNNRLYLYLTDKHPLFHANDKYIMFNSNYIDALQSSSFIGIENNDGMQRYIIERLSDMGIQIKPKVTVDNPLSAMLVTNQMKNGLTLTSNEILSKIANLPRYNLMTLPEKALNLDNSIIYPKVARKEVVDLANYFQERLYGMIAKDNQDMF